jgi:hypothetical protein
MSRMIEVKASNTYFYTEHQATKEDTARLIGYARELKELLDKVNAAGCSLKLSVPSASTVDLPMHNPYSET